MTAGIHIIMHGTAPQLHIMHAQLMDGLKEILQLIKAVMAVHRTESVFKIHLLLPPFVHHFLDMLFPIGAV